MGVVIVTWLFWNFAVCRDAARRVGLSATAELLVLPAKAREYGFTGAGLSVCVSVCDHDN